MAHEFSRRYLLTATFVLGVTFTTVDIARSADLESEVVFAADGGIAQNIFQKELIPEFTRQTGVKVTYIPGQPSDNLAKLRTQKSTPSLDVVWLAGAVTYQAVDEGLVAEIDRASVPNAALIAPGVSSEKATLPVGISIVGTVYLDDVFKQKGLAPPTSWWDFWDAKLRGHVGGSSINISTTQAILVLLAREMSGDSRNVDPALAKFRELRTNSLDFYTSPGVMERALAEGDLWMGWTSSSNAQRMIRSGIKLAYVQPKEGGSGFPLQLGIVKGGPHPKAAASWVNYLLSTEVQQKMVLTLGYRPVNVKAAIPDDIKNYYPPLDTVYVPDWRYVATQLPSYVDKWNRIVER